MKRCPECRRDYYDETLLYCLEDGAALLAGVPDEPATALFEVPPSRDNDTTKILRAEDTALGPPEGGIQRGFDKRLLLAPLLLAVIVLGGFFGYRYLTQARQIDSFAVMPFLNESGNPDVEYLSDGMTESLINSLSTLPNLSVKARNTVFRYKGKEIDEKKVGQELSVQAVLFGRFIQRGDDMTLFLSLVESGTGNALSSPTRLKVDPRSIHYAMTARYLPANRKRTRRRMAPTWPTPALNGSFSSDFGYTTAVHPLLHETLP